MYRSLLIALIATVSLCQASAQTSTRGDASAEHTTQRTAQELEPKYFLNYGTTLQIEGFPPYTRPSSWNSDCAQYVAALILTAEGYRVDKKLYDEIGRAINPKQSGVNDSVLANYLENYVNCKRLRRAEFKTLADHLDKGLVAKLSVQPFGSDTYHAVLLVGYSRGITGDIKSWSLQDNGVCRGTHSHEDFAKLWAGRTSDFPRNSAILIYPSTSAPHIPVEPLQPIHSKVALIDHRPKATPRASSIRPQSSPSLRQRLDKELRELKTFARTKHSKLKKQWNEIKPKLQSISQEMGNVLKRKIDHLKEWLDPDPLERNSPEEREQDLHKTARRLEEIRKELKDLSAKQKLLSGHTVTKINPFAAHPMVPLRIKEFAILQEAIKLQRSLPYGDPNGVRDQITHDSHIFIPTFADGSIALYAPYYGATKPPMNNFVLSEQDLLRHLKELKEFAQKEHQENEFIAPYPSLHEEIDELIKRSDVRSWLSTKEQREQIRERLEFLIERRNNIYQNDADAFQNRINAQVAGAFNWAQNAIDHTYQHLLKHPLEHLCSFSVGLHLPLGVTAIRRWRAPEE